ncbi:MAG: hypothetical protein IJ561_08425 [Ruminococcus sp.]|nr:hypothetical protein [Ruminococcus sp.]
MKLTYRDKVVLIALVVILVWVIGVMFFIKPKFEELDQANADLDAAVVTLDARKATIKEDEGLEDRVKEAYQNVTKIADNFYDKMTSDEVSTTIDTLLDEDNITNDSLSISSYSQVTLNFINGTPMDLVTEVDRITAQTAALGQQAVASDTDGSGVTLYGPVNVPAYTIAFGFRSDLEDLKTFLDKLLTRNEKSLVVTSCSITDVNADVVEGSMTMVLLMMPRLENPLDKNTAAAS